MFIIFIHKKLYPENGSQMGESTIIVQSIKRKTKNMKGSSRENKKPIKKRFLVFLVAVREVRDELSTGIGMTNLVYI
jgi:hypothetical protein